MKYLESHHFDREDVEVLVSEDLVSCLSNAKDILSRVKIWANTTFEIEIKGIRLRDDTALKSGVFLVLVRGLRVYFADNISERNFDDKL